jgi:hypothetical protein
MEAVVAHELAEFQSANPHFSWRHAEAIMRSYRNPNISEEARAIIADQMCDAIAGGDSQIVPTLALEIQQVLAESARRAGLIQEA